MRHHLITTISFIAWGIALGTNGFGQGLQGSLFSVGTTTEDSNSDGQAWIYLAWQSEDLQQLKDRTFAIYSKPGEADSLDSYELDGIARTRLDPAAILALVNQGEELGDDPVKLESDINSLFEGLVPDASLPLEDKISAVVEGCLLDPELFENLIFLSKTHPSLSLILGTGFAGAYADGEIRTWEIRECPPTYASAGDCDSVVGRITMRVGDYRPLPAPGQPVYVPFSDNSGNPDPRAHLNVPLRWSTPDDLRLRSLLQFGYNLFRMDASDAIADNYDSSPPSPIELQILAADAGHSTVQVNGPPILIDRLLTEAESTNTVIDPQTYFYIDDNDRYDPGGVPFENGEEYYYFVTARDLLGRIGEASPGTPVLICDFQPPPQAKKLNVTNHYTYDDATQTNTQHFKVKWEAPDTSNAQTPETITGYRVYRWWSIEEMQQNDAFPDNSATSTQGGLVAVLPASQTEFIDDGSNAPFLQVTRLGDGTLDIDQSYANKTFWYTVRTIDGSACGGNLSGNSAPAYGVLRDRIGPPKPDGVVRISCYDIRVVAPDEVQESRPWEEPEPGFVYLTLEGARLDTYVRWVEFGIFDPDTGNWDLIEPRHTFPDGLNSKILQVRLPQPTDNNTLEIACRMGGYGDTVSVWNNLSVPFSNNEFSAYRIFWQGESIESVGPSDQVCDVHVSLDPQGTVNGIELEFDLTPTTEEWKVYRRIDDGRMTLLAQGLDSALNALTKIVEDLDMPAKDVRVCYFVQVFDQHGNPSPIARLGCVEVQGKEDLPAPLLSAPSPLGDETNPLALLSWFSPPYGIEYFEVWVTGDDGVPASLGADFESPLPDETENGTTWRPFPTKRIAVTFPGNTPEFATVIDGVELGKTYRYKVRPIGPNGSVGPFSKAEEFTWNPDTSGAVSGPDVPWPALGLPEIESSFNAGIKARTVNKSLYDGGAVRIGALNYDGVDFGPGGEDPSDFPFPPDLFIPENAVYRNADGESLFPFVIYRYQIPNATYPAVSGDVYQVTPMLESIPTTFGSLNGVTTLQNEDPFLFPEKDSERLQSQWYDLLVKDTQPVISGASYRYLIVRFDEQTREIAEIIPTNTIFIP
jgi:hypothetical protein